MITKKIENKRRNGNQMCYNFFCLVHQKAKTLIKNGQKHTKKKKKRNKSNVFLFRRFLSYQWGSVDKREEETDKNFAREGRTMVAIIAATALEDGETYGNLLPALSLGLKP